MLPQWVQSGFLGLLNPVINFSTRSRINPNLFTTLGLLFNILAATSYSIGAAYGTRNELYYIGWGGVFIYLGGICDIIDGKVARGAGLSTRFGALYDSVLDRYSEVIMFIGMGYYLIRQDYFYESIFCFVALGGSTMVSYIRARSESLHLDCKVGLMQRPERIVWLATGSFFCGLSTLFIEPDFVWMQWGINLFKPIYLFTVPIFVVAIFANLTSIQRLIHTHRLSQHLEKMDIQTTKLESSSETIQIL